MHLADVSVTVAVRTATERSPVSPICFPLLAVHLETELTSRHLPVFRGRLKAFLFRLSFP